MGPGAAAACAAGRPDHRGRRAAADGETIVFAGPDAALPSIAAYAQQVIDGRAPPFPDSSTRAHAHDAAGDRRDELRRRLAGPPTPEIAAQGGGIVSDCAPRARRPKKTS